MEEFELIASEPLITPQIFCKVFPFHIMFDRQMRIVQAGKSVSRVIPKVSEINCWLLDVLEAVRPHIKMTFQNILSHINTIYVLKTKQEVMIKPEMFIRLKVNGFKVVLNKTLLKLFYFPGPNDVHRRI